jgi:hypothetical protein
MKSPIRALTLACYVLLATASASADWQSDLDRLLNMQPGAEQDMLIESVAAAEPGWKAVTAYIQTARFSQVETGRAVLDSNVCLDGVARPWVLYVPSGYSPGVPVPLLVRLHGGVGRTDIIEDPLGHVAEDEFVPVAEERTWLVLYPYGQAGATWWDRVGMANVNSLIRMVKRAYNVDDDRVWMEGFSDGASAGFSLAMVMPSDYAAIAALNGHIGVGSLDGDLPLYARNLANTPMYAVTTKDDELYPSSRMRPTIEMARRAGADILYRELEGTHDFDYAPSELPRITRFFERHPRDPLPHKLVWEAGGPRYGQCRWFKIERISTAEPAPWHTDHNIAMIDDRVTIGFVPEDSFDGSGVKVGRVIEETAAGDMGLEQGDIIVVGGDTAIETMDDLVAYKATLRRGGPFELTVVRDQGREVLNGQLPEIGSYYAFKRDVPSGLAEVSFSANRIDVETSRIDAFSILVHPDMIDIEDDLVISWNGETVHEGPVEADIEFMLRNFLQNRDRRLLYVARLHVESEDL